MYISSISKEVLCVAVFPTQLVMSDCVSEQSWWRDKSVRDYALASGLMVAPGGQATNVSVTLQPSVFPEELFHQALSVQTSFNSVVDAVSRDVGFLQEVFDK